MGYGGFAVSLGLGEMGLGEMVMMFAATGGDVVRGGCGCGCWRFCCDLDPVWVGLCCRGFGRLVLPWVWVWAKW